MAGYFALAYIFSHSVKTDSDLNVLWVTVLGYLRRKTAEKKGTKFEQWLDRKIITPVFHRPGVQGLGGRNEEMSEKTQEQLLVNNLNSILKERAISKASFISSMEGETAKKIVKLMDGNDKKIPYVYAGNPLEDSDAVKKLEDNSEVVQMVKRYCTRTKDIQKIKTLLTACGKSILGTVFIEEI